MLEALKASAAYVPFDLKKEGWIPLAHGRVVYWKVAGDTAAPEEKAAAPGRKQRDEQQKHTHIRCQTHTPNKRSTFSAPNREDGWTGVVQAAREGGDHSYGLIDCVLMRGG